MSTKMEQNSGESRSGEAMSIFGQSIDVRRPVRSRRRATQKKFSPSFESPALPSVERLHQRSTVAERERARAVSELSRTSSMANELEQQIQQPNARARSPRSEIHGTRAGGSRRNKPSVDVEAPAPGADQAQDDQSNSPYVEVMQELDRVKRELRKLQREVKAAKEATTKVSMDAENPTPMVSSSASRRVDSVKREADDDENEGHSIAELAKPGGSRKDTHATWTRAKGMWKDTSRSTDAEERFATASSSDVGLESVDMAMVLVTTDETCHVTENVESALTITHHVEHDDDLSSLQAAAAEAELTSARVELESIREEGIRLTDSIERTREETARVTDEIDRITEQEKRASAQVQQLNARLFRARSRLDAATAADERAEAMLAELSAALRQLGEEAEAAEKERAMTEHENQCVMEDVDTLGYEIAAAEQRIRELVKELEAAKASEAAATAKLRAVVDSAMQARAAAVMMSERSGNVAITRFEYEYLAGRGEVVRAIAEKKVAAAEAWVEALRAGEKEVVMRADAIEREIGEIMAAGEAEDADDFAGQREPRVGLQRTLTRRRPEQTEELPVTSRKTGMPLSSAMARKASPGSFRVRASLDAWEANPRAYLPQRRKTPALDIPSHGRVAEPCPV